MEEYNETIKRKAYVEGLKLKNTSLDEGVIYAKLEKQGIPAELAKEVARNVIIERSEPLKRDKSDMNNIALFIILAGVLLSIIIYLFTGRLFIAFGFLISGIILAIKAK